MRTPSLLSFLLFPATLTLFGQGSLTPPAGPPSPLFKTLQQIEPRVDVQNSPTIVDTSNSSYEFVITQPGSYYLSGNLSVVRPNGILIASPGITLDLNGFSLGRFFFTSGGNGIEIAPNAHRAAVRNGSVQGFANGILSAAGPSGETARNIVLRDLAVGFCSNQGIGAGVAAVLESCRAHDNGGAGVVTGAGSSLSNCTAYNNSGLYGISAERASSLTNCSVSRQTGDGTSIAIRADAGSSLTNCTASANTVNAAIHAGEGSSLTNCTARENTGVPGSLLPVSFGINAGIGSSLQNCTATGNTVVYGISATASTLTHCTADSNTSPEAFSYGISTVGGSTFIGCTANYNTNTNSSSLGQTGGGFFADIGSTVKDCTAQSNKGNGFSLGDLCVISGSNANGNGNSGSVGNGIQAGAGVSVSDCTISNNRTDGIRVLARSLVAGCNVSQNGTGGGFPAGIRSADGTGSRIDGNQVRDNIGTGILANAADVVVRNTAGGNTHGNYNPASGTNFGTLQAPNAATNPMANVAY